MELLLSKFSVNINPEIYLKEPESSALGRNILKAGIELIDEIGFEDFTFRKLGQKINTSEASVYRYFESKYKFLIYLSSWYWAWIEYQLMLKNANIASPQQRLENVIRLLAGQESAPYLTNQHLDMSKLFNIICNESSKAYLNKEVDSLNQSGVYFNYKKLVSKICGIVFEISPDYKYPHMLITTIIEGIHHQKYFSSHLPALTDTAEGENTIVNFYTGLVLSQLSNVNKSV